MACAPLVSTVILPTAFGLSGRTALVSGAGSPSGIGLAAATMLGQFAAGVILTAATERVHD